MIDAFVRRSECTVILPPQADASDPFVDKAGVLTGAYVLSVVDPARESVVLERSATALQPSMDAGPPVLAVRIEQAGRSFAE
jgi:hypothetical protein